jgi:CRP/FNR family transcriptional regulator
VAPIDDLERFEPFRHLSDAGKGLLRQGVVRKRLSSAAAVVHKGQAVSGAYVALEGRLRVFTIAPNGTEATLYFIDPGETCVLALNCLFNDLRYPAWVDASPDTRVAIIDGPSYRWLFDHEAAVPT